MKSKKILLILVSIIALTLILNVKSFAAGSETDGLEGTPAGTEQDDGQGEEETDEIEWPDFSNAKVEFVPQSKDYNSNLEINVSNVKLDSDNYDYTYEISNNSITDDGLCLAEGNVLTIFSFSLDDVYARAGDIYITITAKNKNALEEKVILNKKKIDRIPQFSLGNRMNVTITSNHLSISIKECIGKNRTLKTKIGQVTDENLLKSIGKNESGWRTKLLEYAKNAQAINTGTIENVKSGANGGTIDTGLNLINGAYYFLYLEVDDENGAYYPVEDICFTQGHKDGNGLSYLSTDWKMDEPVEETPAPTPTPTPSASTETPNNNQAKDPTVSNTILPKTGEGIAIFVAIVAVAVIGIVAIKKYQKYKEI